ncbi:MAG: flagellar assembly protein FliW [Armatimonadetes bacterium]|nr:flagellar assembly protein FliW [Armatimonadota bacterium]MBS1726994.1 flagellar assembly protein FliW [Armatimonadota bacterium]
MNLYGTRFGDIDYAENDIVHFSEGMIGFTAYQDYIVVNTKEGSPFKWLQSVDEPKLAFLVSMPNFFVDEYSPEICDEEAFALRLTPDTQYLVLVTTTIPAGKPKEATANLAAPIIINLETRHAKQVILEDQAYTIRYPIFSGAQDGAKLAAA